MSSSSAGRSYSRQSSRSMDLTNDAVAYSRQNSTNSEKDKASSRGPSPRHIKMEPNSKSTKSALVEGSSSKTQRKDRQDKSWKCMFCTMENSSVERICSACGRSQHSIDYPTAGESKRRCPSCTYENYYDKVQCEMCMCLLGQDTFTYV